MTCVEVREILSDLIDVRGGEIPPAGVSRLSEPEVRADAESHLAGCSDCRAEMVILEEVGSVFSDFSVGELPAQHFSDYGKIVREKMASEQRRKIVPIRAGRAGNKSRWWTFGASAAVAACAAFAFLHFNHKHSTKERSSTVAQSSKLKPNTPIPAGFRSTPMNLFVNNDVHPAGGIPQNTASKRDWIYNPENPDAMMKDLVKQEDGAGRLILGEKAAPGELPLLGVQFHTTHVKAADAAKSKTFGLKIADIVNDSVANEMGLMRGDEITNINGMEVHTSSVEDAVRFLYVIHNLGKGSVITIDVMRQDKAGFLYIQRRGVLGEPKASFE